MTSHPAWVFSIETSEPLDRCRRWQQFGEQSCSAMPSLRLRTDPFEQIETFLVHSHHFNLGSTLLKLANDLIESADAALVPDMRC